MAATGALILSNSSVATRASCPLQYYLLHDITQNSAVVYIKPLMPETYMNVTKSVSMGGGQRNFNGTLGKRNP